MKCIVCGLNFTSKRNTAKYCTPTCRKLAFQDKGISVPLSVPNVTVPVSVPIDDDPHQYGVMKCQVPGCSFKQSPGHHDKQNRDTCIKHWDPKNA